MNYKLNFSILYLSICFVLSGCSIKTETEYIGDYFDPYGGFETVAQDTLSLSVGGTFVIDNIKFKGRFNDNGLRTGEWIVYKKLELLNWYIYAEGMYLNGKKTGEVDQSSVTVLNSIPCLDQVCIDAIKKSKWRPAKQGRSRVGVYLTKTFNFTLEKDKLK